MVSRRGISILDLVLGLPGGTAGVLLPDDVRNALESLAVLEHRSTTTTASYIHEGTSQALGDEPLVLPGVAGWALESPVVTTGLPFRVLRTRATPGTNPNVEAASTTSTVDLYLDPLAVTFPRLIPALVAGGTFGSANPAHLVPDPDRDGVRLWGRAILRITLGSPVSVALVDWPDPFDPAAVSGEVAELSMDPPTFLFGTSGFGATVDRVVLDLSAGFTPADVVARGQDAAWTGVSLREGTLYFPRSAPIVGDLSIGLHDLLVGLPPSANGVQGEAVIELGRTPVNPTVVEFVDANGALATELNAAGYTLVYLRDAVSEVKATLPTEVDGLPADPTASWVLPDGTRRDDTATTGWFTARTGESMRAAFTELVGDERIPGEEETYVFTLAADSEVDSALPTITLTAGATVERVASVSGSAAALDGIAFRAELDGDGDPAAVTWQLGDGATAQSGTGATFAPRFATLALGRHDLVLRHEGAVRRCELQVLETGDLVAGAAEGPRDGDGTALAVSQILATYDLAAFDRDGRRVANGLDATFDGDDGVDVPPGGLAHVTIGTERLDPPELRHVQVLMLFNQATAAPDQFLRPDGTLVDAPTHVGEWAASFDGDVQFLVIGRCCDIGDDGYNDELARKRAALAATWIDGDVVQRSEQEAATGDVAAVQAAAQAAGLLDDQEAAAQRLIEAIVGEIAGEDTTTPPRPQFRRADIYAVGGTPTDATLPAHGELMPRPEQREALLPGDDAAAPVPPSPRNPKLPFRTRLTVGWDSPSVHEPADAVPTLAELLLEWATTNVTSIPALPDPVQPVPNDPSTEVFTLVGRWTHDPQSGQTLFTLAWDSSGDPDGLAHLDSGPLAFVLAIGPALLGGIDSGEELGVSLAAVVAAGIVAAGLVTSGTVVLNGIEYQVQPLEGGPLQRLVVDYSVALGFDSSPLLEGIGINIKTDPDHPMRVRYRNVGVELDLSGSLPWYETLRLVYDDVSFEIEDPGAWTIDGPLGEVLSVVGTRAGAGSTWMEVDVAFRLDLGVVTISQAVVRVTIDDDGGVSVSLRGITVSVDVPGTLSGTGTLSLGAGGVFRAGIDVTVVPAQLTVGAALAFEPQSGFFFLEVKAILPVGIPLGPSGLGLYGFVGRFVTNGTRAIEPPGTDLVARELEWYRKPAADKYRPEPGQWALGLGAVVGTALDTGFSFNAMGMFVVSFPDPSVVFSIEARFLSSPGAASDDPGPSTGGSGEIIGLAVVDPEAVVIGVDGSYTLPDVIDLRVPVGAYFPGSPLDTYVRIGADGIANRTGDPVTATLLPGLLDAKVWSYLMIEGGRLLELGGDPRFTFDGFCVGFGAGWSVEWKAGPASLRASATVLVGLGTKPFMLAGGVFMEGEISLAFVSVGVSGELVVTVQDRDVFLDGRLCASIDLGFFERRACVGISIGPQVDIEAPEPPAPLLKVSLTDRNGFAIEQLDALHPSAEAAVWPDTVPVLELAHPLASALPPGSAFDPGPAPAGPEWSGTSKLKYAYRLTGVELLADGTALGGALDSAWWWSTFRPGIVAEGDVALSAEEGRWLALMSWDPRPWSRLLAADSTTSPGEPSTTASRLCDPVLLPRRACAFGVDAVRIDTTAVELRDDTATTTLPSRFAWRAREHFGLLDLADTVAMGARRGWKLRPGAVRPIAELVAPVELPDEAAGIYEIALLADPRGPVTTMQLSGAYEPALVDAELTLLVLPWDRDPVGDEIWCIDFSNAASVQFTADGFDFKGLHFVDLGIDGLVLVDSVDPPDVPELRFSNEGVRIDLPFPVHSVRVDVAALTGAAVLAAASDAGGTVVDTAVCPAGRRRELTLHGSEPISSVTLTGGGGEGELVSLCIIEPLLPVPDDAPEVPPEDAAFPIVFGTRLDGPLVRWDPTVVATVELGGIECSVVRYDPPRPGRTWVASEIWPWLGGRIGVISTCGVSSVAQQLADDQSEYVDALVEQWSNRAAEEAPERAALLAADTGYTLRVSWQYQSWVSTDGATTPPPTDPDGWQDGTPVSWSFRTAAAVPDRALPVEVDVRDESRFDPRAIVRYLLALDPAGGDATTHFLDDPILAHFSVDHLETLLSLYDRVLTFSIKRTDPPPGSASRYGAVALDATYGALPSSTMTAADARFVAAAATLPCVDLPALGGTTAHLAAELEPRARYDLRLVAAPEGAPDAEELLVAVVNFVASRYASPEALLGALGFTEPASPVLPHDAIVVAEPPRGAASAITGDAALDATLAELGLDPWPLPLRPRVVALWRFDDRWLFEGVLVEADEALVRPGRLTVDRITVGPAELDVVRVSSSGARLLATPAASTALAAEENVLTLVLGSTTTGLDGGAVTADVAGARRLLDRPAQSYRET